jgi:hypothetical protein
MAKKQYGTRKKYHYIYKTTNMLSGRYYIGMHSTDDLNDGYLGSGTLLRRSINKHGRENFKIEILEFVNSREELAAREKEIVSLQEIAKKECMNLKVGGNGGLSSAEHAYKFHAAGGKATRQLLSKRHVERLQSDDTYRKNWITNVKKGLEAAGFPEGTFKGRKHKPETIELMKKAKQETGKGHKNSQYGTCWITDEYQNRKIYKGDLIPEGWRLGRITKK